MGAYRWAKTWTDLTSNQKFVLVIIADYYNDDDKRAWPAIATIAADTCLNARTVTRCLRELERQGLIETEPWFKEGSKERAANRYYLPLFDPASVARPNGVVFWDSWDQKTGALVREEVAA